MVPPKESTSTPRSRVAWRRVLTERRGGVGEARAIHVQEHVALVGKAGERLNFFRLVNRAHLGGLSNRDDAGLGVVLVTDAVVGVAD